MNEFLAVLLSIIVALLYLLAFLGLVSLTASAVSRAYFKEKLKHMEKMEYKK